jgi:hypothetical protein
MRLIFKFIIPFIIYIVILFITAKEELHLDSKNVYGFPYRFYEKYYIDESSDDTIRNFSYKYFFVDIILFTIVYYSIYYILYLYSGQKYK